jgi:hypothetical protein
LVCLWRTPNTYPKGGVRRGTATQNLRDPGQPRESLRVPRSARTPSIPLSDWILSARGWVAGWLGDAAPVRCYRWHPRPRRTRRLSHRRSRSAALLGNGMTARSPMRTDHTAHAGTKRQMGHSANRHRTAARHVREFQSLTATKRPRFLPHKKVYLMRKSLATALTVGFIALASLVASSFATAQATASARWSAPVVASARWSAPQPGSARWS